MKRGPLLCVLALPIAAVIAIVVFLRHLENTRRPAREIRAHSVAYELIHTTNSIVLDGINPEFKAELARILAAPTWQMVDKSGPVDGRGVVRLILTNDHGQALHMRLKEEADRGRQNFRFRLLNYRKITGDGAANGSQPIRSITN